MNEHVIIFSVILATSLLLTGVMVVLRKRFFRPDRAARQQIHSSIFSFFATLYAFFLGFAIVTLWSAFLHAKADVIKESDALMRAFQISRTLPDAQGVRQALMDYVKAVRDEEWPEMDRNSRMHEPTGKRFDLLWERYLQIRPKNQNDNDMYVSMGSYLHDASGWRTARELCLKGNLYPPVWVLIIFGFITMLYCLYVTNIQQNPAQIIFEFVVIFFVLSFIYFIADLDSPFSGSVNVLPHPFDAVYQKMVDLGP
jgi:hypothetical protein